MKGREQRPIVGRLYDDLVWLWPIISPPSKYIEEGREFGRIIESSVVGEARTLLDLGCGGGHNDHGLKDRFRITGVDLSGPMLDLARRLNPGVEYVQGDMRTVRLGRTFDAVTIFDAINYMLTPDDLGRAFTTAYVHLRPGGVLLTYVEQTPETFHQNWTECSTHRAPGVDVAFAENSFDPEPGDGMYEVTYVYLIRRGGGLRIETDVHRCGMFSMATWLATLEAVGFDPEVRPPLPTEAQGGVPVVLGRKPGGPRT